MDRLIAFCNCSTKTPKAQNHDERCLYRTLIEGSETIESLRTEIKQMQSDIAACFDTLRKHVPEDEPPWVDDVWITLYKYVQALPTKDSGRAADDYDPRNDPDLPDGLRDPQETLRHGREVLNRIESEQSARQFKFRAGDVVKHLPTDETWVLAFGDREDAARKIAAAGWPCTVTDPSQCEIIKPATDIESAKMLADCGGMKDRSDVRGIVARNYLALPKKDAADDMEALRNHSSTQRLPEQPASKSQQKRLNVQQGRP